MRKIREILCKKRILILIAALVVILLALCVIFSRNRDLGVVSFSKDTVSIEKYESYQLELKGAKDEKITWKSDNEKVAMVVDGVVYGRKKGSTQIHATVGRTTVSCKIVVADNRYVPTIDLRETNDSVQLSKSQTYQIAPLLSYNGNTYTDVEYTYQTLEGDIKVDEKGMITTSEAGEGIIAITGEWRENKLETLLFVTVVDVSTSLEVGDNSFNLYLNGDSEEYPGKIDIGITAFDKDVLVDNPHGSVTYVEQVKEGDTKGAATIKKGIAYAAKLGTTHYVAQYKSASGTVVESAEFSITVDKTPADIYMAPIEGEEFEFFFQPLNTKNSVEWDESKKAYHLVNTVKTASNARGFIIDKEYLMNIIKYTKADSISFEVKTDGQETGLEASDKSIYQGFYPDWFKKGYYQKTVTVKNWTKYTIYFKDIPKDDQGELKTIFLLNTVAGMYVRNIKPNLPGADTSNYDPNHNYLEAIKGEDYEFFIEPLDSENSVVWDKKMNAYHLENKVTVASNRRGFIFNRDYLTNIIKHTNAESITFEVKTDGKASGLQATNKSIYQGYYPDWHLSPSKQNTVTQEWKQYTIYFEDIPLDADGAWKTIFLLNTDEGMYVRNIRPNLPGQSPTYDYTSPIVGESYKFFIEPLYNKNSVKWDEEQQMYHLINTKNTADTSRGFIFNDEYMKGIQEKTEAIGIRFQVKSDGKTTGISSNDKRLYQGYWPDWYVSGQYKGYTEKDEWITIELRFENFPKDKNGNIKTVYLMNTDAGMYLRNIEPIMPGEETENIAPTYNYNEPITGESYEFFIEALSSKNSVKWDKTQQAYHLTNTMAEAHSSRGFIFNADYMNGVQENTNAIGIRFQVKSDGIASGISTTDKRLYQGFWPDWYVSGQYKGHMNKNNWITIELKFEDFPKDAQGNLKTVYLMNTDAGMYIRNISLILPKADSDIKTEENGDGFVIDGSNWN